MVTTLSVDDTVAALRAGRVVALPTDTVYGLGVALTHPASMAEIYQLKQRPASMALPVLVASTDMIGALGVTWEPRAEALAEAYWPGALTIVVPVPPTLAATLKTDGSVGFRRPSNALLQEVVAQTGPLAVTSANLHGQPPCQSAAEVLAAFGDSSLAGVLDDGRCDGVVSTVVALDTSWRVLREGAVSIDQLTAVLGPQEAD
jgi:tRNA threonylcarbamoyl adenosine modification protein (Sua5/YciO/YrdC/YwlC family)